MYDFARNYSQGFLMPSNQTPRNKLIAIVAVLVALILAAIAYFAPNAQTPNANKYPIIAMGFAHSFVIDSDGKVYATGRNNYGQLGLGDNTDRNVFTPVVSLEGKKIVALAAGGDHSLALDESGKKIVALAEGGDHSLALDIDGKLYATGSNRYGQFGFGDKTDRNVFTVVSELSDKKIVAIAAGSYHSLAVDENGKLYAAGNN
jgi:alpha-tubulin suppressor-like RCC1 family protein